jgi:hypothetical protein
MKTPLRRRATEVSTEAFTVISSPLSERRNSTRLRITPCEVRPEALKCAIEEWLVPALSREFLRSKGIE